MVYYWDSKNYALQQLSYFTGDFKRGNGGIIDISEIIVPWVI